MVTVCRRESNGNFSISSVAKGVRFRIHSATTSQLISNRSSHCRNTWIRLSCPPTQSNYSERRKASNERGVKGYLLDTNHVGAWERKEPKILARLESEPNNLPRVSTITIGELEFGNRITSTTNQVRRDEYKAFIVSHLAPFALSLTIHTASYYAQNLER